VIGGLPTEIDLANLVAEIVEDAKFEAQAEGKSVVLTHADDVMLAGRPQLLARAVENVLRNAVRYTAPATSVRVELRSQAERAILTISDSGPGMSSEEIAGMFEPFFRASPAFDGKGFGLGLAIAKRAVDVHDGTISARNLAGGGLRVTIEVPLEASA
jgi:two-component system, OmpR family, sensor kinase